jgi:hypothetical protein
MTNPTDRTRRELRRYPVNLRPATVFPLPTLEVATS